MPDPLEDVISDPDRLKQGIPLGIRLPEGWRRIGWSRVIMLGWDAAVEQIEKSAAADWEWTHCPGCNDLNCQGSKGANEYAIHECL
jgi:hypothetical protein